MCLAVVAWQVHPDYPLVLAANRDEFYARSTRPASWWGQSVALLAGRDEEAGGTWLGITRSGRLALLTNVRAPSERNPHAPSRGAIAIGALQSPQAAGQWLREQAPRMGAYNGFNLLIAEPGVSKGGVPRLVYYTNRRDDGPQPLAPGIYGLSNAYLDTPWPKVVRAVSAFACALAGRVDADSLLTLMADRRPVRDSELPSTGVPLEWERALASIQIRAHGYGTRSTTVVTVRRDGVTSFLERSFAPETPELHRDRHFEFTVDGARAPSMRSSGARRAS
ncbi:MAG: NRDE family protein [Burkholderiales bacterium]|jgi:uncharacterized protein with NRDE domain|nr:NRDE family protein [Burkholderiales bacterium]